MAGDHKCPVCQSTFTRPQHVARHMRSHTGDRPYKCQHCGDQFARSDLLSRHINKCHASEKPPTTTVPSRRKGTAAASRATTSKQACDQCVTSSLPCDGANPCSKCVQRKCRCTFVKFHRQTAPSGPGHPVPPTMPPAGHGRHSISLGAPRLPDDFLLAPPPGTMALSSMYAPHHYPMSHSSAVYPHDFTSLPPLSSALAPESSMSTMMQPHHRENIENSDTMARFRAQAELLSRAGVMPNGALTLAQSASAADTGVTLPGLYAASGSQESHYDNRYNLPQSDQWDGSRQFAQTKDFEAPYGPRSQSHTTVTTFSAAGAAGGEPSLQTHPPMTATSSSYEGGNPASYHHHPNLPAPPSMYQHHSSGQNQHQHSRSDDVNSEADFGSDAGSSGTGHSHSIPSSANSSTVHLPLPGFNNLRTRAELGGKEGSFQGQNPQEGEGGFSSAFGLMSLDDPNVLAGIANDGQPFFSGITFPPGSKQPANANANANPQGGGMALATPTQQDLLAQLKSAGGRTVEMDSKEMHEFWKMYLRTPLTGTTSSGANGMMFPLQTPTGPGAPLGQARPSSSRRHSRVASLPSMKTPPLFADGRLGQARPSTGDQEAHAQQQQQQQEQEQAQERAGGVPVVSHNSNSNSTVRTAAHDADDLRSYEQAVLARRAPMTLNLVPKRKGSLAAPPSVGARPPPNPAMAKSKSMSPVVPHAAFASGLPPGAMGVGVGGVGGGGGSKIADILNRPPSSSSASTGTAGSSGSGMSGPGQASSSLAHAFGGSEAGADGHLLLSQHGEYATAAGAAGSYRPSFKRIASQTLGPAHTKRALLGPAGWDRHHQEEEDDEEGRGARGGREEEEREDGEDMGMRGIHERGRRLAAQVHG